MPTYQADAVVLRRLDYGEADRILTLLTREHGKLAAIAKGSRRAKARSGNSLDLFARSRMMLAKGRNLDVVAQVERRGGRLRRPPSVRRRAVDQLRVLPWSRSLGSADRRLSVFEREVDQLGA